MNKTRPERSGSPAPATTGRRSGELERVAWSNDGTRALATGATLEAAREAAKALGEPDPILEPAQRNARIA
jgi:hypothetical protein